MHGRDRAATIGMRPSQNIPRRQRSGSGRVFEGGRELVSGLNVLGARDPALTGADPFVDSDGTGDLAFG